MSTTIKISGSFVIDPANLNWDALVALVYGSTGKPTQSKMRSAVLEFPPLTAAQYADWFDVCDVPGGFIAITSLLIPRRTDAAYTLNPEAGSFTAADPTKIDMTSRYTFHFRGGSPGRGGLIYNTRIEAYTYINIETVPPP